MVRVRNQGDEETSREVGSTARYLRAVWSLGGVLNRNLGAAVNAALRIFDNPLRHWANKLGTTGEQFSHPNRIRNLTLLEELWLSDNAIRTAADLSPLRDLPCLQTIRLSGCPIAATPDYVDAVRQNAPATLTQLDADPIDSGRG